MGRGTNAFLGLLAVALLGGAGTLVWAADESDGELAKKTQNPVAGPIEPRLFLRAHPRLDNPPEIQEAEATSESEGTPAPAGTGEQAQSLSEVNRQLTNPVTSIWSLTFQFNNYRLDNGTLSANMLFQPVLPVSLTEDWNLINRPVLPIYQSNPRPTLGTFHQTTTFGDIADAEMISPAHSGNWLLGVGPTFIFPTAGSVWTGQGHYQMGPAGVLGYLTKQYIVGVFPQQWWSIDGKQEEPAVSQMNLQPFAAWFLPNGWSVGYSGNILANWHADNAERWTVPLGASVAKVVKFGPLPVRIALAGQYMVEHPSVIGQEWNVQLIVAPVIPKLFKGTIF